MNTIKGVLFWGKCFVGWGVGGIFEGVVKLYMQAKLCLIIAIRK